MNFKKMAKRFFTLSQNHDGFTLVELIVVIAIMAILAGVAVPAYTGYINKANKASDLQLLGAVNTAFAAACMENNVSPKGLANVTLIMSGESGAKTIASVEPYGDAFARYYAGNTGTFKVIEHLFFNPAEGVFVDNTENVNNAVNIFNQSNFAGKVETLAGSVNNLAGMLADRIGRDGVKDLYVDGTIQFMSEADYNDFMAKYNLTEDSSDTEIANATVMHVADKLSGYDAQGIGQLLSTGTLENNFNGVGAIPAAALMYGLMTGYVNSEYNTGGDTINTKPGGITEVLGEFDTLSKTEGFQNYFNNSNESLKGGTADVNGILSAMDVINSYEGSFDLTQEDLFVSDETNALLNSILGSK